MNLGAVMDDLGAALETIDGLRVLPYWASRITPPAAIVGFPDPYTFDATYRRGADRATFPLSILVANVDSRSSRDSISGYVDGSGPASVKAAIDAHQPTAYHTARVESVSFEVMTVAGIEYLASIFQVDIVASGD